MSKGQFTAVLIVPTGIGAAIGGYAGDAIPIAKMLAQVCDRLITHPNVLNGAQLYWNLPNALYVEGYGLDRFAAGDWGLQPVIQNRIGLLFDQAIEPELIARHLQAADAVRATLGLNLTDYAISSEPLEVELRRAESGTSWGTIGNTGSLLRTAAKLIDLGKAEAIAIVTRFPDSFDDEALQNYRYGRGVDYLAGAEAIISHLIVRQFGIPCAHAPALSPLPLDSQISPRAAAEELGYTFLPCVLVGLSRSPQFVRRNLDNVGDRQGNSDTIWADSIDALIIPASACGGSTVLSLSGSRTQIVTVAENKTAIDVFPESLGIKTIQVNSYLEVVGAIVAHKAGIDINNLNPHLTSIRQLS
jgi:hypothetical protein